MQRGVGGGNSGGAGRNDQFHSVKTVGPFRQLGQGYIDRGPAAQTGIGRAGEGFLGTRHELLLQSHKEFSDGNEAETDANLIGV